MKKAFAVMMVSIISLLIIFVSAYADTKDTCGHHWVYTDEIPRGQWTQTEPATCSISSSIHTHYRHVWGTEYIYVCSICNETKTVLHNTYGSWVCTLNEPAK